MGLSIFQFHRLLFILVSSYLVVCLTSWSFAPSEQTTFQLDESFANPDEHFYESRLQVQRLLHLESEVISFCWLIIEQDEMLHHAEASRHDSEHIKR